MAPWPLSAVGSDSLLIALRARCPMATCSISTMFAPDLRCRAGHKLLLVGVARMCWPGSMLQIVLAILLAQIRLVLLAACRPFRCTTASFCATFVSFLLVVFLVIASTSRLTTLKDAICKCSLPKVGVSGVHSEPSRPAQPQL